MVPIREDTLPRSRRLLLVALLLAPQEVAALREETQALEPVADQMPTALAILSRLDRDHYRDLRIDDAFSEHLLDSYLTALDPARIFFLAADVAGFERDFANALDDALQRGNLHPAFEIFNRYRERRLAELDYSVQALEHLDELRFDVEEAFVIDREDAPWPADEDAQHDQWRKYFKNEVLSLRLAKRTAEQIEQTLTRRYGNQRNQLEQMKSRDVFGLFMNLVSGSYDPHTQYLLPRDAENFDIMLSLSFQGIGAVLARDGELTRIDRLIPGGPAERSGELAAADRILAVGQGAEGELVDVVGWRTDEIADLVRGPKGSTVRLEVRAADAPVTSTRVVVLTRDEVRLEEQAARSKTIELDRDGRSRKVGVIELPTFYADMSGAPSGDPESRSSTRDVARLLEELQASDVDGVVMDLRGNGGGSLTEAQSLAGLFVGRRPVVQVKDATGRVGVLVPEDEALYEGPLVVMVDRLSASASEIFAAAMQDLGRGVVVGSTTFGKGTVQTLLPVERGERGELVLTQAKFYRVSGGSTQLRGVTPDIPFPSVYDPHDVGESALPEAMEWDSVRPLKARRFGRVEDALPRLKSLHAQRSAQSPAFLYQASKAAFFEEMSERREVSLNEKTREREAGQDEKRLLEIENAWREARGLEPVDDLASLERADEDDAEPFAREAAEILLDLEAASK